VTENPPTESQFRVKYRTGLSPAAKRTAVTFIFTGSDANGDGYLFDVEIRA